MVARPDYIQAPKLAVKNSSGNEDAAIILDIEVTTTAPNEHVTLLLFGLPSGATLNQGTRNLGGSYTLNASQLVGLTLTPPSEFTGTLKLIVVATATQASSHTAASSGPQILAVTVNPVAEAPILRVSPVRGNEGAAIALSISLTPAEKDLARAHLSLTISGLPTGATLNKGKLNPDGSYTLTASQLVGLTLTPPAEFTGTVNLTVVATDSEPSSHTAASSGPQILAVTVNPVAEAPILTVSPASGYEGTAIALSISATQVESDLNSANLSVKVSGLPKHATLNHGTRNGDSSYTLTASQLMGLTLTPPSEFTGTLNLTVVATDREASSHTKASGAPQTLTVTVGAPVQAEAPTLAVSAASGAEGSASIPLAISAAQSESDLASSNLSVTVSGLEGATLSAGTLNPDGSYTLTASQLAGLALTPAYGIHGDADALGYGDR